MKAQALRDSSSSSYMSSKKTLEINPSNPIIASLRAKVSADQSDKVRKDLRPLILDSSHCPPPSPSCAGYPCLLT